MAFLQNISQRLIPALLLLTGCVEQSQETWWKGNLHTHTFWSDGDDFPEMILSWYQDNGYDFIALSDHNTLADSERWLQFRNDDARATTFESYLDTYGEEWVDYRRSQDSISVRLKTFEEYSDLFSASTDYLIMRSEEITDRFESQSIHVNATNIAEYIAPQGGSSVVDVMQRNVDAVLAQREATGQPMIPHINHPNFGWSITPEQLSQVVGERFFEVYNGHPAVHNEGDSLRPSIEMMWDFVNTIRLAEERPLMYGIGVDDAHHYQDFGLTRANTGRGWIMVKADELSAGSLIDSMERGEFYVSTGVLFEKIDFDGARLSVSVRAEEGVSYKIQFIGVPDDATSSYGEILAESEGPEASYDWNGSERFIRARVLSSKLKTNPYREGEVERAWTQPVIGQ